MRVNSPAAQLTAWSLWRARRGRRYEQHPSLADGWLIDTAGLLRLRSAMRPEAVEVLPADATAFEASESHQHLDAPPTASREDEVGHRIALWSDALGLAFDGLDLIRRTPNAADALAAVSLGGPGQGATVRWHLDRGATDRWLDDDLAGYAHEAVAEISTRDLDAERLEAAVLTNPFGDE